ncbi:hypothetical protein ElyMa_001967600 [Elysia marginata]|uniref:Uncharacterized protein n=1 Tax=Elysia marginata TaxID=1093978 RepID=A0AAV4EZ68_9GAST|nr:hypothetical protein ElyMa_001967600 [Elysia marginata]
MEKISVDSRLTPGGGTLARGMKRAKLNIGLVYSKLKGRPREEQTNTLGENAEPVELAWGWRSLGLELEQGLGLDWTGPPAGLLQPWDRT